MKALLNVFFWFNVIFCLLNGLCFALPPHQPFNGLVCVIDAIVAGGLFFTLRLKWF